MVFVLLTIAAAVCTQSGFMAWKAAATRLPAGAGLCTHFVHPLWWCGMAVAAGGWALLVWATALGEVSIVQPLMSLGDLLLVAAAVLVFRERLTRWEWLGVAMTLGGAVVLGTQAQIVATH